MILKVDNLESWRKYQLEDPAIIKILYGKENNQRPPWQEIVFEDSSAKIYWSQWVCLVFENGVLYGK